MWFPLSVAMNFLKNTGQVLSVSLSGIRMSARVNLSGAI